MRRTTLIACGLALVFALAPLARAVPMGGPLSKPAYEAAMKAIAKRFDVPEARALQPMTKDPAGAALQNHLAGVLFGKEATALAAIVPPNEVAADHRALVAFDRAVSQNYFVVAAWLSATARGGKTKAPPPLASKWVDLSYKATSDLHAKGYKLGGFTGDSK